MAVPRDKNYDPTEPCDPVPMVWSADSHALLEVEECGFVMEGSTYEVCPECGGSGWRYVGEIEEREERLDSGGDGRHDLYRPYWVVVVRVGEAHLFGYGEITYSDQQKQGRIVWDT